MKKLLLLGLALFSTTVFAEPDFKAEANLLSSHTAIVPGETLYLALSLKPEKGWHTYWRNPGDSGAPTSVEWQLPKGVSLKQVYWEHPEKIDYGSLVNYGFHHESLLVYEFEIAKKLSKKELVFKAAAEWLICKDVCIPESLNFEKRVRVSEIPILSSDSNAITRVLESQPRHYPYEYSILPKDNRVVFELQHSNSKAVKSAYFFSGPSIFASLDEEQVLTKREGSIQLELPMYDAGTGEVEGVLELQFSDGSKEIFTLSNIPEAIASGAPVSVISALLFAFLGGLILNLMPCVFPILSLKVLSIASNAILSRKEVAQHALLYGAGVTIGLWALFAIITVLKASGEALGWGFHLQSPYFVGALIVLITYIGFYLLDIVPLPSVLYSATSFAGSAQGSSAFLTGLLAVVVATPCTAPFMAVAIGAAFSLPIIYGFLVFTALAFGFSAPFLILAIKPDLAQKLPKPGPWLDTLKEAMAFPMLLTVLWLLWVLYQQAGISSVLLSLCLVFLLGFSGWLSTKIKAKAILWWLTILCCVATVTLFKPVSSVSIQEKGSSVAAIQAARAAGKSVFVDVTASWCITCQVNKKAVLQTEEIQRFFSENDIEFIVLDWTNKDDEITQYLESYGRNGVPLYVAYPNGEKGQILPQILSELSVKGAFK